ncbi:MAG: hypothetical protein AVDCRST_MAG71-1432 [uncultured Lysobacter sp.]|uniref:Magnesium and cobalt transport protein CorA n=1 Tax=uncultured Lysobacter sp. TaxID=271060 RepID=A0A6J4LB59_9GAMM|nr:MAG: hypothetical protein AVDCRST_MAG71-1432 [uncultured Lysobacter sp.]
MDANAGDTQQVCSTTPAPTSPLVRMLHFDRDRAPEEVDVAALATCMPVADARLLWIDVTAAQVPDALLDALDLDASRVAIASGFAPALAVDGTWKYLQVFALDWQGRRPTTVPLTIAIGRNTIVTVHAAPVAFLQSVLDEEIDQLRVGSLDAMTFASTLLDRMLTDYLDARDEFENVLDRLELQILRNPQARLLRELQHMRRFASKLRQYLADQRDVFDAIGRPDFDPALSADATGHCQRLRARYAQVTESMEAARELVNGSFDLYTSRVAENTNQTMHTLTFVTVVIGVMATIAGVMGMNFKAPVYDTGLHGFIATLGGMLALAAVATGWLAWRRRAVR